MQDDDDALTEPEPDGSFYKSQTLSQFLSAPPTEQQRVQQQVQRTSKAPFFGKLADKKERQAVRQRDRAAYGGPLEDSDSGKRVERLNRLIADAKSGFTIEKAFIEATDNAIQKMSTSGSTRESFSVNFNGAKLGGHVDTVFGKRTVHVGSIYMPHEMRGDNSFPNYIDHYLGRGDNMQVHTIIGPAMAAIAYNRGFHVYPNESISNFANAQDDLLRHSISGQTWYHQHSPLNKHLRENRTPLKFIDLQREGSKQSAAAPRSVSSTRDVHNLPDEIWEKSRLLLMSPEGKAKMAERTDRTHRLYNVHWDPRNPQSEAAGMYQQAGVTNPFLPDYFDNFDSDDEDDLSMKVGEYLNSAVGQRRIALAADRTRPGYHWDNDPANSESVFARKFFFVGQENPYEQEGRRQFLQSAEGQAAVALAADKSSPTYQWLRDPRNPNSRYAADYLWTGLPNPYLPTA